jgi:hypothetical protein
MKREIVPELNAEDKTLMENILAAGKICSAAGFFIPISFTTCIDLTTFILKFHAFINLLGGDLQSMMVLKRSHN